MFMPLLFVCSKSSLRSCKSCPEITMNGPGSMLQVTFVGSGFPYVVVLAVSSISIQVKLMLPSSMMSVNSSSVVLCSPSACRPL